MLLAFVIAQIISQQELTRRGYQKEADAIPDLILACVIGTLIGGKLYYAGIITRRLVELFGPRRLRVLGRLHRLGDRAAGLSSGGRSSSSRGSPTSAASPSRRGYAVGRTGCWAVGDDYGRPWDGPLAVMFPEGAPPSTAGNMQQLFGTPIPEGASPDTVLAVHPTQLYETALGFVMFLILWRFRDHKHAEGWLFGMYCVLAGAERFFIEFFRAKDDRFFDGADAGAGDRDRDRDHRRDRHAGAPRDPGSLAVPRRPDWGRRRAPRDHL